MEITGRYGRAVVFTGNVDEKAIEQIRDLCDQEYTKNCRIRIMPDVHAGAGCTIGTTMTVADKIVPNIVGVDIGCGMHVCLLGKVRADASMFRELDKLIRERIPFGFDIRKRAHPFYSKIDLDQLKCREHADIKRAELSIGTLGGGNHFIEMDIDMDGSIYLVIHSGSRHLGKQIAEHYQKRAASELKGKVPGGLSYVSGRSRDDYLNDMEIAQNFADINRKAIARVILDDMGFKCQESFTTVHNYIALDEMILRKGAISAKRGETVLIPISMRDGSIIARGRGNADWNFSAPHGAGRVMSRTQAKKQISLEKFKKSMEGIFSTSISRATLDEAPFAYRSMDEMVSEINDTVDIVRIIRPVYNFKG